MKFQQNPLDSTRVIPGQENLIPGDIQKVSKVELWLFYNAFPLNVSFFFYHFVKFKQNPLYRFGVMLRTKV